jgi:hypothetical protein
MDLDCSLVEDLAAVPPCDLAGRGAVTGAEASTRAPSRQAAADARSAGPVSLASGYEHAAPGLSAFEDVDVSSPRRLRSSRKGRIAPSQVAKMKTSILPERVAVQRDPWQLTGWCPGDGNALTVSIRTRSVRRGTRVELLTLGADKPRQIILRWLAPSHSRYDNNTRTVSTEWSSPALTDT